MKICFLLQRNFAYIGHFLAMNLKERYGIEDFCAYVQTQKSYDYITSQKDINYGRILFDEDLHERYKDEIIDYVFLNWLEKEYGFPNLWPYLTIDRIVMSGQLVREYPYDQPQYSYEEMLKLVQIKAKAIIKFLEEEKPDVVFFSVISAIGSMLLYRIARKMNIKTLVVFSCLMKERYILTECHSHVVLSGDNKCESRSDPYYKEAEKFISDYRLAPYPHQYHISPNEQAIDRTKQLKFLHPKNTVNFIIFYFGQIKNFLINNKKFRYSDITPGNYLVDRIKRKIRNIRGVSDLYDKMDRNDNFAFYPLQYEPEFSLLVQAPFFTDQLYVIKQIARSLPVGFKLYVKEHPQMVEYRPRAFYKKLKNIPNVKLINPKVKSFEIYRNVKLVTTITGTAGWEATLLKIPVIVFGDNMYNTLSFVKKCKTIEDLPFLVKSQLENYKYSEEELRLFVASLLKQSAKINLHYLWSREKDFSKKQEGIIPLADLLARNLGLTPKN